MRTIQKHLALAAILALFAGFSSAALAQGGGKSVKTDYTFAFTPCNGEPMPWGGVAELINATGTLNLVIVSEKVDENGCVSFQVHANSQNVRGVGAVTGNEYRIIDVFNQQVIDQYVCGGCTVQLTVTSMYQVKTKDGSSYMSRGSYDVILNICTWEVEEIRANFGGGCD